MMRENSIQYGLLEGVRLATVLRYAGYTVEEASSGEAALDVARTKRPDLITADILMPEMTVSSGRTRRSARSR